ncbi:hypothetical protein [Lederbergia lenta]|uniref:hypothetical protein n=1 Tax=Lederbergia lenta TaxID=1467 RepID=UPI00203BBF00|nr:hypothetical protein [Lederbergia lenta]MCM3110690.1 hypothetical protein [Lederbergia lenta]
MGLLKDIRTDSGILVRDAYFRVDTISCNKDICNISLLSYINRNAFLQGKSFVTTESHTFSPDLTAGAPNLFQQAYDYLKTIEDFEDAEDVIEIDQSI